MLDCTVNPGKVFDRTVGLDEVPDAYRAMDDRETLKVMIAFPLAAQVQLDALVAAAVQNRDVFADVTSGRRAAIERPGKDAIL